MAAGSARRAALTLLAAAVAAAAVRRYLGSDRFDRSLIFLDRGTFRYYCATVNLFRRNRADCLGEEWDGPGWEQADAEQADAARSLSRWLRVHIDRHVHRQLGWDDRTGWMPCPRGARPVPRQHRRRWS